LKSFRLVEESALRRTLEKIGIARATFYRWYQQPQTFER
jgi:predicted DNA-binding transcriptional regulator AlpA